jgi:hypothetical protein
VVWFPANHTPAQTGQWYFDQEKLGGGIGETGKGSRLPFDSAWPNITYGSHSFFTCWITVGHVIAEARTPHTADGFGMVRVVFSEKGVNTAYT